MQDSAATNAKKSAKRGRPHNRSTEAVRAYAATTGTFTLAAAREALGLKATAVDTAVDTLLRGKRLVRVSKGTYQWVSEKRKAREAPLEERIWHAMRINPTWSAADIAQQAATTVSYVYKRLRVYRAEGLIKRKGAKHVPGGMVKLWRVTSLAARTIDVPRVEEYSPDSIVVAAVRLNRLVCTGLVRFVDERREAIGLCNKIINGLAESNSGDSDGADTEI